MCVLGMSHEYKGRIGVNALWPKTAIATEAGEILLGEKSSLPLRRPDIVADAAYEIFCRNPKETNGNFFFDEDIVKEAGVIDLSPYTCHVDVVSDAKSDSNERSHTQKVDNKYKVGKIERLFEIFEKYMSVELTIFIVCCFCIPIFFD